MSVRWLCYASIWCECRGYIGLSSGGVRSISGDNQMFIHQKTLLAVITADGSIYFI